MAKKALTIDQQLARLEQIRQSLENADRPIEELITLYEEGMQIVHRLRLQLQDLRQRVITIGKQLSDPQSPNTREPSEST